MSDRPIHYEAHPVSPARKAELIAAGYRILDVKFKPKDAPAAATPEPTEVAIDVTQVSEGLTVDELKAALKAKGVSFRANASRASLVALLAKE